MFAVLVGVVLFLLASSNIDSLGQYSIVLRVAGACVVLSPAIWHKRTKQRDSFPRFSRALITVGSGFALYVAASNVNHGDVLGLLTASGAFVLVYSLTLVLLNYYSCHQVVEGAFLAFFLICGMSLVMSLTQPEIAFENDRLRGVMENANGLGFVSFALAVSTIATRRQAWKTIAGIAVASSCLFMSGSRASLLAVMIYILGSAMSGDRRSRLVVALGGITLGLMWLALPGAMDGILLLRTADTRSAGFSVMERAMGESFWTGLGVVPVGTLVAGSPFVAGITGGFWGLFGLGVMYWGLMSNFLTLRPRAIALVIAGVTHSFFESWMLSFSAPMLLSFFVLLIGFARLDASSVGNLPGGYSDSSGGQVSRSGIGATER